MADKTLMQAMIHFMKTLFTLSGPVRLWMLLLMTFNMALPLLFITTVEGIATLAAAMAGAMTMSLIFQKYGFVRLLGIGHIYWLPLVIWLLSRLEQADNQSFFQTWISTVIVLNSLSLLLDLIDVIRYFKGERSPYLRLGTGTFNPGTFNQ